MAETRRFSVAQNGGCRVALWLTRAGDMTTDLNSAAIFPTYWTAALAARYVAVCTGCGAEVREWTRELKTELVRVVRAAQPNGIARMGHGKIRL